MRKLLLTLTAALLGVTAARAAEPVTITLDAAELCSKGTLTGSVYTLNLYGEAAVIIQGKADGTIAAGGFGTDDFNNKNMLTISPGDVLDTWQNYEITGTDSYRLVSYRLVVGPRIENTNVDNIKIDFNGTTYTTSESEDVIIEGTGTGYFKATTTFQGHSKKGLIKSATFVVEPVIPEFENGVTIAFNSTDYASQGTLSNDTYITKDDPAAKITGGFYVIDSKLGIAPKSGDAGSTYNISANDPESYSVAYFRFVIAGLGNDNINVTYNNVTKTTSDGTIILEGYASNGDPMSFIATQVGTNHKGIFESAIIILVPTEIEEGKKIVTFDNTDANDKGDYTLVDNKIADKTYTTKDVPRVKISTTDGDLYMYDTSKLCVSPGSTAGSNDDTDSSAWKEFTIAPARPELYRLVSAEIQIQGFGTTDHIKICYNGEVKSTEEGIVTVSYPVEAPAAQADEVTPDPVIKFKATPTENAAKKGEIKSATFVLEPKDNVTTGLETITGVMNSEGEVIWYDLRGRRVENPANGIFVNSKGKKHLFAN